jgi:pSer/pThr/pTyr-binding forkhead associated (FHA) protein
MPEKNPLISLCACSGSVKFIHFKCLNTWLLSNLTVEKNTNNSLNNCFEIYVYKIKKFYCELCKIPFPLRVFDNKNKKFKFLYEKILKDINANIADDKILILETIDYNINLTDQNQYKYKQYFYIIKINQSTKNDENKNFEILIGRNKKCDIRIKSKSNSKINLINNFHAGIVYSKNEFYLIDKKSKYGSLVLQRKNTCNIKAEHNEINLLTNGVSIRAFLKVNSQRLILPNNLDLNLENNFVEKKFRLENYFTEKYESILKKLNTETTENLTYNFQRVNLGK